MFKKYKVLYAIATAVLLSVAIGVAIYFYHSYLAKKELERNEKMLQHDLKISQQEDKVVNNTKEHEAYLFKKELERNEKMLQQDLEISQQEDKVVNNILGVWSNAGNDTKSQLYPNTSWLPIAMDIYNDIYAINLDSLLKNTNETKTFWYEEILSEQGKRKLSSKQWSPIYYSLYKISSLAEVNCKNQAFIKSFSIIAYNKEEDIENDEEYQGGKSTTVPPNSALSNIVYFVCLPNKEIKDIAEEFRLSITPQN